MTHANLVPETVTSPENQWLKRFRAALTGEPSRRPGGEIAVEGLRIVTTALQSGTPALSVLFSKTGERHLPALAKLIPTGTRVLATSDKAFARVAATENPQGVAALLRQPSANF